LPARFITWFQAAAAARNAGKRLPTNAEWQVAALGTPEGLCNTSSGVVHVTGTAGCVSEVGAFDMVGNLWEWVADWVPRSTNCGSWGGFSDDAQCLAGAETTGAPGALFRGGGFGNVTTAGVFAVFGSDAPSNANDIIGFRAAR
jgi:formylglycine-generating enzyme required for sulfatase activity